VLLAEPERLADAYQLFLVFKFAKGFNKRLLIEDYLRWWLPSGLRFGLRSFDMCKSFYDAITICHFNTASFEAHNSAHSISELRMIIRSRLNLRLRFNSKDCNGPIIVPFIYSSASAGIGYHVMIPNSFYCHLQVCYLHCNILATCHHHGSQGRFPSKAYLNGTAPITLDPLKARQSRPATEVESLSAKGFGLFPVSLS